MSRISGDDIDNDGAVRNGYDYRLQAWVKEYTIQDCGHPSWMQPNCCPAHRLAGADIRKV